MPLISIVPTMDQDMPKAGADWLAASVEKIFADDAESSEAGGAGASVSHKSKSSDAGHQRHAFTQLQPVGVHEFKLEYLDAVDSFMQEALAPVPPPVARQSS